MRKMTYHAKDNWYFERQNDGNVHIYQKSADGQNLASLNVDANMWASIVASVSIAGEDDGGFYRALEFHNDIKFHEKRKAERDEAMKVLQEFSDKFNKRER